MCVCVRVCVLGGGGKVSAQIQRRAGAQQARFDINFGNIIVHSGHNTDNVALAV